LRKFFGDRRASTVTTDDIDAYIIRQRKAGYSEETIGTQLRRLRQAFRLQSAVPVPKFPPLPKGRARDWLITPDEQDQLTAALNDECYADMARFAFITGWRGGEIRKLRWADVRENSIRLVSENAKTNQARDYPLAGEVAEVIERWRAKRVPACPFVFHKRSRAVGHRCFLKAFERAACKIGLGTYDASRPRYHRYVGPKPHDARRAFVTETLDSGVDEATAMRLTGHATTSMIERYHIPTLEPLAIAIKQREQYALGRRAKKSNLYKLPDRHLSENPVREDFGELRKANGE
jgi:integrase